MLSRAILVALLAMSAGLSAACSSVTAGVVIEKAYDDPDRWTTVEPEYKNQCRSTWRRTTYVSDCTRVFSHYETEEHYDGPHWRLRLRSTEGETGWVEVDKATFDSTRIGGRYP